jgi:hypothetical protein
MDNMNFAETLISKKIKEADSTIDISNADRKLLQLASQDLTNYLKFNTAFTYEAASNLSLEQNIKQLHKEDHIELESFLTIWISLWLRKWKQRIRLLINTPQPNEEAKDHKALPNTDAQWRTLTCKKELIKLVVSTLIRNAEICGTEILAEHLIKTELNKKPCQNVNNKEHVLTILNNVLRRAREMAQVTGPLINLKVDKSYFFAHSN